MTILFTILSVYCFLVSVYVDPLIKMNPALFACFGVVFAGYAVCFRKGEL